MTERLGSQFSHLLTRLNIYWLLGAVAVVHTVAVVQVVI
jgi:hypothetical protein